VSSRDLRSSEVDGSNNAALESLIVKKKTILCGVFDDVNKNERDDVL
jgi:hypothetical protein